jgi:CRP-like cAMP-binding protein
MASTTETPLLRSLAGQPAPTALVARLAAAGRLMRARRGQVLLAHGARSDEVQLVQSGRVRVELLALGGREVTIRDLGPGQLFGELAAIDSGPRSTSIVALEDTMVLLVPAVAFRDAVAETPESATWFAGHLVALVRNLTDRLFELSALNVQGRIHCQLLRMAAAAGVAGNRAVVDPMPTHEELASLIGTHREAVTRELSWLAQAGMVQQQRRRLDILDVMELSLLVRRATGGNADPLWEIAHS